MKKSKLFLMCLTTAFFSCNKNDDDTNAIPTNLKTDLSIENNSVSTEEGGFAYINFNLSEALSEDLKFKSSFNIEEIGNYANDGDISDKLFYSNDNGENWEEAKDGIVVAKAGSKNLKVRLEAIDDDIPEIRLEETNVTFENNSTNLDIGENTYNMRVGVTDNDVDTYLSETLLEFEFNEANEYKIIGIKQDLTGGFKNIQKKLVDGEYKDLMDDIQYANTLLPVNAKIKKFEFLFQESGLGGYVYNANFTQENNENSFVMGLNALWAYAVPNQGREIPYNENGEMGYILAHELGHVLTLERLAQADWLKSEDDCQRLYFNDTGCFNEDSYLNAFNNNFYLADPATLTEPLFVSPYAGSHIAEDIAESIATFITQEDIPQVSSTSSTALQKVNQILNYDELKKFKTDFKAKINIQFGSSNSPISSRGGQNSGVVFNKFDDKFVPCSEAHLHQRE